MIEFAHSACFEKVDLRGDSWADFRKEITGLRGKTLDLWSQFVEILGSTVWKVAMNCECPLRSKLFQIWLSSARLLVGNKKLSLYTYRSSFQVIKYSSLSPNALTL